MKAIDDELRELYFAADKIIIECLFLVVNATEICNVDNICRQSNPKYVFLTIVDSLELTKLTTNICLYI